jgi:hypothetical protein
MWLNNRVSEAEVARILSIIANPPNLRDDPDNPYVQIFDGGLLRVVTGYTSYEFSNGIQATVSVLPWLSVSITFPDGRYVSISQNEPE